MFQLMKMGSFDRNKNKHIYPHSTF